MDDKVLVLIDENGKEIKAEILFTHHSDKFNKDYVVFLPENDEQYSAAIYNETNGNEGEILPIETEEEWKLLEDLLNDYFGDLDEE